jgi:hypothetical protein
MGHRSNGAAEKVCSGQESNTSGAKARGILNHSYGPTKQLAEKPAIR